MALGAQNRFPYNCGWPAWNYSTSSFALNLSASGGFSQRWAAIGFVPAKTRTLNTVRFPFVSVTGSPVAADISLSLCSSSSGVPGSVIETQNLSANPTSGFGNSFTGFTTACTQNQQYWLVMKNANAAPTTNYVTLQGVGGMPLMTPGPSNIMAGWSLMNSANSGTSWTMNASMPCRLGWSDGTYDGIPAYATANGDLVYSSRESGVQLTTPANVILNVVGAAMFLQTSGTPSAGPRFNLYSGASPSLMNDQSSNAARTAPGLVQISTISPFFCAYFSDIVQVPASTVLTLTLGEGTNSDTSTNRYFSRLVTFDTDTNSLPLIPFGAQQAFYDGSSWTYTAGSTYPFALILDSTTPVAAGGGGSTGGYIFG